MIHLVKNTGFEKLLILSLLGVGSILFSSFPILEELDVPKWTLLIQPLLVSLVFALVGLYVLRKAHFPFGFKSYKELLAIDRKGMIVAIGSSLFLGILLFFLTPYLDGLLPSYFKSFDIALVTKLLYGGINEELIMRLGVLSFMFYMFTRFLGHNSAWILALTLSSLLFAVGHLPLLYANGMPDVTAVLFVIGANFMFGMAFGYLYMKYNLLTSMVCHAFTHLFHFLLILTLT